MIVDANVLLYAVDSTSPHHAQAARWLTDALNGQERVGFAWQSIGAFVRIATHPRISANPLSAAQAQRRAGDWRPGLGEGDRGRRRPRGSRR